MTSSLFDAASLLVVRATTAASTPSPAPEFDESTVTPGLIGFLVTFGIVAIVVLLVIDMVRRIRRVNYRAEIGKRLDEERSAADQGDSPSER